jgi:tetratricopeptide (TPR) repeat protein
VPEFLLDVPAPGTARKDARAALDDLATYSLATRDPEGDAFLVHRLVQDVTRRGLEALGAATVRLTEALCWVDAAFVGDSQDVRSWPRLDPLVPHAAALAVHADAAGIADPTGQLLTRVGLLFITKALYAEAEPLARRALVLSERLGANHPLVARALTNLSILLRDTNRLDEAEPLMWRALAIDEASLDKHHPGVAINLSNLGQWLKDTSNPAELVQYTNRLAEAERLMRRALAIDQARLGKDHPNVAIRLSNLALLMGDTNRLIKAERLMHRALAIDKATFGKDHPNVAEDLGNLGYLLRHPKRIIKRSTEAEPLIRRALTIHAAIPQGPSKSRAALQQPRSIVARHQPARRGGAADAPRTEDLTRLPARHWLRPPASRWGDQHLHRPARGDGPKQAGDRSGSRNSTPRGRAGSVVTLPRRLQGFYLIPLATTCCISRCMASPALRLGRCWFAAALSPASWCSPIGGAGGTQDTPMQRRRRPGSLRSFQRNRVKGCPLLLARSRLSRRRFSGARPRVRVGEVCARGPPRGQRARLPEPTSLDRRDVAPVPRSLRCARSGWHERQTRP